MQNTIYIIEDDPRIVEVLTVLYDSIQLKVKSFANPISFLKEFEKGLNKVSCILIDVRLPLMSGLEVFKYLIEKNCYQPIIIITGHADIEMAVQAMKNGAFDFLTKPFNNQNLIETTQKALQKCVDLQELIAFKEKIFLLTPREKQTLKYLFNGKKNKEIAFDLQISLSTVELHRANILKKLGMANIMEIFRFSNIFAKEIA